MNEIEQLVTDNNAARKEIEEMAKVLDEIEAIMWENAAYDTPDMAKAFYNAGYRNVKNKVVIPEEITEETSPEDIIKIVKYNEKVRKEMAREIYNVFRQIFKNYGVEVE